MDHTVGLTHIGNGHPRLQLPSDGMVCFGNREKMTRGVKSNLSRSAEIKRTPGMASSQCGGKATLIYKRTGNLRTVQLLLGHTKIETPVRHFAIEVDDALAIAEQVDI